MKNWVWRSLTRTFGRAASRDRMLADLYVAVRQETYSQLVVDRAQKLAFTFNDSHEVGQCVGAMIDYVADGDSPGRGIELSRHVLNVVPNKGPVFEVVMSRTGSLHRCDAIYMETRKQAAEILNGMRLNEDRTMMGIVGMYLYDKDAPRRQMAVYPRPAKVTPEEFQRRLKV